MIRLCIKIQRISLNLPVIETIYPWENGIEILFTKQSSIVLVTPIHFLLTPDARRLLKKSIPALKKVFRWSELKQRYISLPIVVRIIVLTVDAKYACWESQNNRWTKSYASLCYHAHDERALFRFCFVSCFSYHTIVIFIYL